MKRWLSLALTLLTLTLAVALGYFAGYRAAASRTATEEVAARERSFAEAMSGVVLEGSFTARSDPEALRSERYSIDGIEKIAGDYWLIRARLDFGGREIAVPVPVRLAWAEDTPMVTLTDASLPGLGTFTARVVFYRDGYAGLWWAADSSGHQFGRILREPRDD